MADEMSITDFLKALDACPEAVTWAVQFRELEELWPACRHAEWLIWLLEQVGHDNETGLRLFAADCARHHWNLLADPRSRRAVEIAEYCARRMAGPEELREARDAALKATVEGRARPNWTAASAAAAITAYNSTRASGLAAAREASKHGLRAAAWDPGTYATAEAEDAWQADQFRRIMGPDLPLIVELARRKMRTIELSALESSSNSGAKSPGAGCGCSGVL